MVDRFHIIPIGIITKNEKRVTIEIHARFQDALLGLEQFSHIVVLSWFHKNDTPEKRGVLQVHPRRNETIPLTGVFATRSPVRPNPIALSTCKILSVQGRTVHIDKIDLFDGTPVIDIKPCISNMDFVLDIRVPEWVEK
ncbi:MAG: tRNA (N6-threonylcarbamoyladenosine(37)-N6)-methyltransferase TrmO [Pseudomonadota bacterium]